MPAVSATHMQVGTTANRSLLLVDAVPWSPDYPSGHPLRSVPGWFTPHLQERGGVSVRTVSAEADLSVEPGPGVGGVILSGSPRDAWGEDPVNEALCGLVARCRDAGVPLLGVCYGHQVLGRALGARVGCHPAGWELGNALLTLTSQGRSSALFRGIPDEFWALQSHADALLELPAGCELLATGRHTAVQAFCFQNLLFGVQFHPETRPEILQFIWEPRRAEWRHRIGFDLDGRLRGLAPAPDAARVLSNFINHIVP
jgi:GMP synthase (glutamine-hydrolysing)